MVNAPSNLYAMRFCRETADRISTSPDCAEVRNKIVALFVEERKTPLEITVQLNGSLGVPHNVAMETVASAVRRVLNQLVEPEILREVRSGFHAEVIRNVQETVGKARDEWMRENGMHVWSAEENKMLVHFDNGERFIRDIAEAMCLYFDSEEYTYERCKRRLRYLREGK